MSEVIRDKQGFTLIELMIVVSIIGILAAISIPNFLSYQIRARQAEARTNLGGIYVSETAYEADAGRYGGFNEVAFQLRGSNRYTYRGPAAGGAGCGAVNGVDLFPQSFPVSGAVTAENQVVVCTATLSNTGTGQAPTFTATATADLDSDPAIDQWHINDVKNGIQSADVSDV